MSNASEADGFTRRNVGYLYAMQHGARHIFDAYPDTYSSAAVPLEVVKLGEKRHESFYDNPWNADVQARDAPAVAEFGHERSAGYSERAALREARAEPIRPFRKARLMDGGIPAKQPALHAQPRLPDLRGSAAIYREGVQVLKKPLKARIKCSVRTVLGH